jgi:hypothetical protein
LRRPPETFTILSQKSWLIVTKLADPISRPAYDPISSAGSFVMIWPTPTGASKHLEPVPLNVEQPMRKTKLSSVPLPASAPDETVGRAYQLVRRAIGAALVLGVILPSACQRALAGSSTATLGVSLTIMAGCSARAEGPRSAPFESGIGPSSIAVRCDNVVPYRVEFHPAIVEVLPENVASSGDHRDLRGIKILVVY